MLRLLLVISLCMVAHGAPTALRSRPLPDLLVAVQQGKPGAADALQDRLPLLKDKMTPAGVARVQAAMDEQSDRQMRAVAGAAGGGSVAGVLATALGEHDGEDKGMQTQAATAADKRIAPKQRRKAVRLPAFRNFTGSGAPAPITPRPRAQVPLFNPKTDMSPKLPHTGTTAFFSSLRRANDAIGRSLTSSRIRGGGEPVDDEPTLFTPDPIAWTRLAHDEGRQEGYWSVPFDEVSVNGQVVEGAEGEAGVFDPSTHRLALGPRAAQLVYARINGAQAIAAVGADPHLPQAVTSYSYPCSATIEITLVFADRRHSIDSADFNITPLATGNGGGEQRCLGAVYGLSMLNGGPRAGADQDLS